MIQVTTFHELSGKVVVHIPVRYRALIAQYAVFGVNAPYAAHADGGWVSLTEYRTWIQLPGVVVQKW